MFRISDVALLAFRDEFRKEAASLRDVLANPRMQGALGGAGALGGVGAAVGALGGAGIQGVRAYRAAREEGADVRGSLLRGAGGALGGAQRGGTIGAVLGAGAGALGGAVSPGAAEGVRQALTGTKGGVGAAARFGQRQVHAVTGWKPVPGDNSSIRQIGAGAQGAADRLKGTVDQANKLHGVGASGRSLDKAVGAVEGARKGYGAAVRSEQMGLTSLPGYAQSMKEHGVLPTMSAGFKEQWHGMSPAWKAVMIGAPLAEAAHQAATPDQEGGPGKGERVAKGLAHAVVGSTMGAIPMTASNMLLSPMAGGVGGAVGKGIDFVRRRRPQQQQPQQYTPAEVSGQVLPTERHMSENAAGRPFEVGG